jgi:hypothetical protein
MNTNCLAGVICPACFQRERFRIRAASWFLLQDDGTSEFEDVEYDGRAPCQCRACDHAGNLAAFRAPRTFERAARQALLANDWAGADDLLQETAESGRAPRRVIQAFQALQVAEPDLAAIAATLRP